MLLAGPSSLFRYLSLLVTGETRVCCSSSSSSSSSSISDLVELLEPLSELPLEWPLSEVFTSSESEVNFSLGLQLLDDGEVAGREAADDVGDIPAVSDDDKPLEVDPGEVGLQMLVVLEITRTGLFGEVTIVSSSTSGSSGTTSRVGGLRLLTGLWTVPACDLLGLLDAAELRRSLANVVVVS